MVLSLLHFSHPSPILGIVGHHPFVYVVGMN